MKLYSPGRAKPLKKTMYWGPPLEYCEIEQAVVICIRVLKAGTLTHNYSYKFLENSSERTRKENRDPLGAIARMLPEISGAIARM